MKVGIRKRNFKTSVKARTVGKVKRKVKSKVNPLYGKKNINVIKNPEKFIKDKVYHRVTTGIPKTGLANNGKRTKILNTTKKVEEEKPVEAKQTVVNDEKKVPFYKKWWFWLIIVLIILYAIGSK